MLVSTDESHPPIHGRPRALPLVIQGGMGVAVSSWQLARAVARAGQLGVVSGTALDTVVARRLQDGDPLGDVRRALAAFPVQAVIERVLHRYFRPGGRPPGTPYRPISALTLTPTRQAQELAIVANFVEVWLAKEGHDGAVGVNYLEKIQLATPAALYGAMLAGVDFVLVGAGIPREIPQLIGALAEHRAVALPITVSGADREYAVSLDPRDLLGAGLPPLTRPIFLAIVSAHVLATYLARDDSTRPDGFVIEGPRAGGHNAPPRGKVTLDPLGQPIFGPRDDVDLGKVAALGLPFWLAGSYGTPEQIASARAVGATGVQVGTVFALCAESGLAPHLRAELMDRLRNDTLDVRTDIAASPTGFPFKVAQVPGTLSDLEIRAARPRLCDLSYLRTPYQREGGTVGYRCPGEPVDQYLRKGGTLEDTVNRSCLCNALMTDVGMGQTRSDGYVELPLVTLGADLDGARQLAAAHLNGWSAQDVIDWLIPQPAISR